MKHTINFRGEPPFKYGAEVELDRKNGVLTLSKHDHPCFDKPDLVIPVTEIKTQGGRVWTGEYWENAGKNCEHKSWTVYVFRARGRLYGAQFPTKLIQQTSGVWGADE